MLVWRQQDEAQAAVLLPGLAEKQEKPALSDAWKQTHRRLPAPASSWPCQLRRRPCHQKGLGEAAVCLCKPRAGQAPRQQ